MRVREDFFREPVAPVGFRIGQPVEETAALGVFDPMIEVAFLLMTKRFAIADEKLKIARVRLVDGGIIYFVDDSVAEREPEPAARIVGSAKPFLGAGRPAGLNARSAGRDLICFSHNFLDMMVVGIDRAGLTSFSGFKECDQISDFLGFQRGAESGHVHAAV